MKLSALFIAIEVGGTLAFAMSGLLEATRKRMDIVGVFSVAFVSAFGGGTVRDVLLDRRPLFWIQHEVYLWLVLLLVLSAPLWLMTLRHKLGGWLMELADAFGLGLFAISGTSIATAAVGGVSRDVLCNEIPKVYRDHQPYTLCALAGCGAFLAMHSVGMSAESASLIGIATATGSRLLSVAFDLRLPSWLSTSN